jgi:hypothetical protein
MKLLSKVFIVLMFLSVSIWLALPSSGYPKFFNYNWIVQFMLGPLSHLAHIFNTIGYLKYFINHDMGSMIWALLYILISSIFWLSFMVLLTTWRNSSLHIAFLSAIWIFAGIANLYFYGIGTL